MSSRYRSQFVKRVPGLDKLSFVADGGHFRNTPIRRLPGTGSTSLLVPSPTMLVRYRTRSPYIASGTTLAPSQVAQYHPYNLPTYGTFGIGLS